METFCSFPSQSSNHTTPAPAAASPNRPSNSTVNVKLKASSRKHDEPDSPSTNNSEFIFPPKRLTAKNSQQNPDQLNDVNMDINIPTDALGPKVILDNLATVHAKNNTPPPLFLFSTVITGT